MLRAMRVRLLAAFAAVYLIWGSTYLAIRFAVETLPPLLMAGARFVLAGAVLLLWSRARGRAGPPSRRDWMTAAVGGGLLLLETVNPRSVTGLLEVFNRDLTHEKPLHPETLSFLAAAAGFLDVRVEMLSPMDPLAQLRKLDGGSAVPGAVVDTFNENVDRLNALLYGSLEYAMFARR